jgi:hypothetical protein
MKGRNFKVNLTAFLITNISAHHSMVQNRLGAAVRCVLHQGPLRADGENLHKGRKPDLRCALHRRLLCGRSCLLQMQLSLTQHLLCLAVQRSLRCGEFHPDRTFRCDQMGSIQFALSLRSASTIETRTMQPFASARTYAMRRISPNRPFKHVIIGGL